MISAAAVAAGYTVALLLAPRPTIWLTSAAAGGARYLLLGGARLASRILLAVPRDGSEGGGGGSEGNEEDEMVWMAYWALGSYLTGRHAPEHLRFYERFSRHLRGAAERVRNLDDLARVHPGWKALMRPAVDAAIEGIDREGREESMERADGDGLVLLLKLRDRLAGPPIFQTRGAPWAPPTRHPRHGIPDRLERKDPLRA